MTMVTNRVARDGEEFAVRALTCGRATDSATGRQVHAKLASTQGYELPAFLTAR